MASAIRFEGTGPGPITQDGCAVEHYRRIKPGPEPAIIAAAVPGGGSILELGAGAGRITHALLAQGYKVTAVDNSAEMLASIRGAETILGDIETLELGRRFDAVLLASQLINVPVRQARADLLASCRRHVRPGGIVLIERADPNGLRKLQRGPLGVEDGIEYVADAVRLDEPLIHITLRMQAADAVWTPSYTHELIDEAQIQAEIALSGLHFIGWLDDRKRWLAATLPPGMIRLATPEDAGAVAELHVATWRETYIGLMPDAALAALSVEERTTRWRRILSEPAPDGRSPAVFLAACGDQLVGFAAGGAQRDPVLRDQGFAGEISAIYILRCAQRMGMGRALMAAMAQTLAAHGHQAASLWVVKNNWPARAFYERQGGALVGEKEDRRDAMTLIEVAYGWRDLDPLVALDGAI